MPLIKSLAPLLVLAILLVLVCGRDAAGAVIPVTTVEQRISGVGGRDAPNVQIAAREGL